MEKFYYSSYNAKKIMNWFATVLRVVICFIILTDLTELSVEFCVDEVFEDRGGLNVRRRRRGKSSSLGMPKAPQVTVGYTNYTIFELSLGLGLVHHIIVLMM